MADYLLVYWRVIQWLSSLSIESFPHYKIIRFFLKFKSKSCRLFSMIVTNHVVLEKKKDRRSLPLSSLPISNHFATVFHWKRKSFANRNWEFTFFKRTCFDEETKSGQCACVFLSKTHVDVTVVVVAVECFQCVCLCVSLVLCVCDSCAMAVLCVCFSVACSSSCFLPPLCLCLCVCVCTHGEPSRSNEWFPIGRSVGKKQIPLAGPHRMSFLIFTSRCCDSERVGFNRLKVFLIASQRKEIAAGEIRRNFLFPIQKSRSV